MVVFVLVVFFFYIMKGKRKVNRKKVTDFLRGNFLMNKSVHVSCICLSVNAVYVFYVVSYKKALQISKKYNLIFLILFPSKIIRR